LGEEDGDVVEQILPGLESIRASAMGLDVAIPPTAQSEGESVGDNHETRCSIYPPHLSSLWSSSQFFECIGIDQSVTVKI